MIVKNFRGRRQIVGFGVWKEGEVREVADGIGVRLIGVPGFGEVLPKVKAAPAEEKPKKSPTKKSTTKKEAKK